MAAFLENHGMDEIFDDEDSLMGLVGYAVQEGKAILGYYHLPYLNKHMGHMQVIVRTAKDEKGNGNLRTDGFDTHNTGRCVWTVKTSAVSMERHDRSPLSKRIVVSDTEGEGMIVVNVVNADVLPTYREGEIIKLQMIGYPRSISIFPDDKTYESSIQEDKNRKQWMLADGTLFPSGVFYNSNQLKEGKESDEELVDYMLLRATIKGTYYGDIQLGDEKHPMYIRTVVGTKYGDLDLIHTIDMVEERQRKYLREGAVIECLVSLSGDAAIFEYDKGVVRDKKNNLALLADVLEGGSPERLRYVLAADVEYMSEVSQKQVVGIDDTIGRFRHIQQTGDEKCFAHYATVTRRDDTVAKTIYAEGEEGLVIAYNEKDKYNSLAFIEMSEDGYIQKITVSRGAGYKFRVHQS